MTTSLSIPRLRVAAEDMRRHIKPAIEAANTLNLTAGEISHEENEALNKDGYHELLDIYARLTLERTENLEKIAESLEGLADIVEHYEAEVLATVPGGGGVVEEADWDV